MTTPQRDPWEVARHLGAIVTELEDERRTADKTAKRAIAANRAAADALTEVLTPYRALMHALVANAGTDSRTTLEEAVMNAMHALTAHLEPVPK